MRTELYDGDAIFSSAIEIPSAEEREAYIAKACGDNAVLQRQVQERVAAHFQKRKPAEEPAVVSAKNSVPSRRDWEQGSMNRDENDKNANNRVGPYTLLEQLGESGAGYIFAAQQQEPTPRRVALKLFKDGLDWPQIVARLQAERQTLERLDDPRIAKVFDTGTTPTGRPYLVTELIQGVPITQYCDEHRLTLRPRLELFAQVCEAVQYAHQRGIQHGDLHPSNVLVVDSALRPVPKILDFGAGEAIRLLPSEGRSTSGPETLAGSLEYISPEQTEPKAVDIDTRSDVYSLGVLLYELLTGTTPVMRHQLKQASLPEALRLIREEATPLPSNRLIDSKDRLVSVAAKRNTDPSVLSKALAGEVDALAMKALQKDRTLRYQTASEFARDIQRYLADEPVEAYPSQPAFRMWKWARKYPRGLVGTALLMLLLVAAGVLGVFLMWDASRIQTQSRTTVHQAEEEREKAQKETADVQRRLEQAEAARRAASKDRDQELAAELAAKASAVDTKLVLAFLKDNLLSAGRPKGWKGGNWVHDFRKDVTLHQAVDAAEGKVARTFTSRPLAEALAREILGLSYLDLGEADAAVKQYERALALREALLGNNNPETIACRNQLAIAYRVANRPDEAGRLYNDNRNSSSHAAALAINGAVLLSQKKPAEAEQALRECLSILQKVKPDDWTTFDAKSMLGEALLAQKKYADAEPLLLSGYEGMKKREAKIPAEDKPRLRRAVERLVSLYEAWGKNDKAAQWQKQLPLATAPNDL